MRDGKTGRRESDGLMARLPWSELTERDDVGALVCMRVDSPTIPVAGSSTGTCEECGATVHVAPTSRELLAAPPDGIRLIVVCLPCVRVHAPDFRAPKVMTARQLVEVADEMDRRRAQARKAGTN